MPDKPRVHAWVTKYALTKGIVEADVEPLDKGRALLADGFYLTYLYPEEWFQTEYAAWERVRQMIEKKLTSLRRQMAKMTTLREKYKEGLGS